MDRQSKKELIAQYKEREVIGGVYAIRNIAEDKMLLGIAPDINGIKNRFEFSKQNNSCIDLALQKDWSAYGADNFVLEILEELKQGETQSSKEFKDDLKALKEMWQDKLTGKNIY